MPPTSSVDEVRREIAWPRPPSKPHAGISTPGGQRSTLKHLGASRKRFHAACRSDPGSVPALLEKIEREPDAGVSTHQDKISLAGDVNVLEQSAREIPRHKFDGDANSAYSLSDAPALPNNG